MSDLSKPYVLIFEETPDGAEYEREGYTIEELGSVPNVGDLIHGEGIRQGDDDTSASSYTVKEVIRRYFRPQVSDNYGARIVLVVRSRQGRDEEMSILYRR
jgi:hypothetical protein